MCRILIVTSSAFPATKCLDQQGLVFCTASVHCSKKCPLSFLVAAWWAALLSRKQVLVIFPGNLKQELLTLLAQLVLAQHLPILKNLGWKMSGIMNKNLPCTRLHNSKNKKMSLFTLLRFRKENVALLFLLRS